MKKLALPVLYFAAFLLSLGIAALPSCGGVDCKDPQNAKSAACIPSDVKDALIDCTKALVTPQTLVDVTKAFTSSDWQSGMETLGIKYGVQVASCAARDVVAVWTASTPAPIPTPAGSGSAAGSGSSAAVVASTSQPRAEVLHAQQYLADKKFK